MAAVIHNVATNIISGFLGVGKTTAILKLFEQKPDSSKWAVLVNEFGSVGIDGEIYRQHGITVKQIPGGCMCCAQGLPLQVAVNRLLKQAEPDRLLIESSGVGHPAGVLKTLQGEGFADVLTLKAGICLLDPEHLLLAEYQHNDLFREQLQLADILVANKTDIASIRALQAFQTLADNFTPAKQLVAETTHGQCQREWLDFAHLPRSQAPLFEAVTGEQSDHWQTHTFTFSGDTTFDLTAIESWLAGLQLTRLKGFINTTQGSYLLNVSHAHTDISGFDHGNENRIEVIDQQLDIASLQQGLDACIAS
jgi:G3E family GTPase